MKRITIKTIKHYLVSASILMGVFLLSSCTDPLANVLFPDLNISIESPATVTAGNDIGASVSSTVNNIGTKITDGSVIQIDFVLSTDMIIPPGFSTVSETFRDDALLVGGRDQILTQIAAGSSSTAAANSMIIASDTPAGNYFLCARADSGNTISESNENNNTACNPIEVIAAQSTVAITSPESDTGINDAEFDYDGYDESKGKWYKDVTLKGEATDAEDGDLTGDSLRWETSRTDTQDKALGTGNSLAVRLYSNSCFGSEHIITLFATDSDGNTISTTRKINIWTLC